MTQPGSGLPAAFHKATLKELKQFADLVLSPGRHGSTKAALLQAIAAAQPQALFPGGSMLQAIVDHTTERPLPVAEAIKHGLLPASTPVTPTPASCIPAS